MDRDQADRQASEARDRAGEDLLGELDLHLIAEGRHERLWQALGCHPTDGASARFAVWAPRASAVSVVGDWNGWDPAAHPLARRGGSGVWESVVAGPEVGMRYKLAIRQEGARTALRADPLARRSEVPPGTASVVEAPSRHVWQDAAWLAGRAGRQAPDAPIAIYELHAGSWRRGLGYRELARELPAYLVGLGFTHAELLPVMEHPFGGSWGYQVSGYYAPTARWGSPDELRELVDALHAAGIGVLLDWVPAHFPRDDWALARFDGVPLYEHADPRRGAHPDWGTLVFDYGRPEVRNFLVANALYWLEEFHADGLRVDAVASMLYLDYSRGPGEWAPNVHGGHEHLEAIDFLRELTETVHRRVPGALVVAEESTAWPGVTAPVADGGLGFDLKWNLGFMHDTLDYLARDPVHRRYHHDRLTFPFAYAHGERFLLPLSHDEVVHGKGSLLGKLPGDEWQRFATLRALLALQWAHPGKKLLFMGGELAQPGEWDEAGSLDWAGFQASALRQGVQRLVSDLNRLLAARPALSALDADPAGLTVVDADSADENVLAFIRHGGREAIAVVANLSPVPREGYLLGLPQAGRWGELLNTDATSYGGSGLGNLGAVAARRRRWCGQPACASVVVPPLAVVWLAYAPAKTSA